MRHDGVGSVLGVVLTVVGLVAPAAAESKGERLPAFAANGLDEVGEFNCSASIHAREVGATFDIAGSWELSFEFIAPTLEPGWHQLVLWGDGRPGRDPIYVRLDGAGIEAAVVNSHRDTLCRVTMPLDGGIAGRPIPVRFRQLAAANMLELDVNGTVKRAEATVIPSVDQPMPVLIGGAEANSQRFAGVVRSVRLGNLAGVAPANGLHERRTFDCATMAYYRVMGPSFDSTKSWELAFEVTAPKRPPGWHQLVLWGDDRPGKDPIYVRLDGTVLEAAVVDGHTDTLRAIKYRLSASRLNDPVPVRFRYSAERRKLELTVGTARRTVPCDVSPRADRAMPVTIGGAGTASQRFAGTISSIRLGNVADGESLEDAGPLDEELPLTPDDRKAIAKLPPLNRTIVEFALEHEGHLVDIGDCWNFANHAVNAAGAKRKDVYVWGEKVGHNEALPGDIIQTPAHTMIVLRNHGGGRYTILNANAPPNGRRVGRWDAQAGPDASFYRPSR